MLRQGRESLRQKLHHPAAGVFHQNQTRDAHLDGAAIHFPHLGRGQDFHARTPVNNVSSRRRFCCSPITIR